MPGRCTTTRLAHALLLITLALTVASDSAATAAASRRPRLIVILVVDQMRADYIDRFAQQWTGGLRRLMEEGAWFRLASYPFLNTFTCGGHATVSTGSFPSTHGIVLNTWWDRDAVGLVRCTQTETETIVGYGHGPHEGSAHSAWRLRVPTLADEMRAQMSVEPRIVTLSMKARSAIMLAGHRADAVTWFRDNGGWATSTAYSAAPLPFLRRFFDANPVAARFGESWDRTLAPSEYLYEESAVGKTPGEGWLTSWPHELVGNGVAPDEDFFESWAHSPLSDEYLGRLASSAIDEMQLGQGAGTDYLGVSFSSLDLTGHDFGPRSHEVQDVLVRLDTTIGRLLDHLDRVVGEDEYVVALTADHGVAPIPERMTELGFDAGRLARSDVTERVNETLAEVLGPGQTVARLEYTELYFGAGVYAKLTSDPLAMEAVLETIRNTPGVARVYRSEQLRDGAASDDPTLRAAALAHDSERSGDVIVVPKAYWFTYDSATTHGTTYGYDARVPVFLMGKGIVPGEYLAAASPADIAPTLSFLSGVTLAQAEGRVLVEAIESPTPTSGRPSGPRDPTPARGTRSR